MAEIKDPIAVLADDLKEGRKLNEAMMVRALEHLAKELQAQRGRMDETMETHAAKFEEKVQELKREAKQIFDVTGAERRGFIERLDQHSERLDRLEKPGKTNNNMQ